MATFLARRLPTLVVGAGVLFASGSAWADPVAAGLAYSWGANFGGQLGVDSFINASKPVAVMGLPSDKTLSQLATGAEFSVALCSDGSMYAWGFNGNGVLGTGTTTSSKVPVPVTGIPNTKTVTQISAGYYHAAALCSDGTAYTWGDNGWGQLGNGAPVGNGSGASGYMSKVPLPVTGIPNGKKITQIVAGYSHTVAVCDDGSVYAWGYGGLGALGQGASDTSNKSAPVAVKSLPSGTGKKVIQVAVGNLFTVALCEDGSVYSWGYNGSGQLGNGNNDIQYLPTPVAGALSGKKVTQIGAGMYYTVALCQDGSLYSWGDNDRGQLGIGSNLPSNVPQLVGSALSSKKVTQIGMGAYHMVALCDDWSVYTWGYNGDSELGNDSIGNTSIPGLIYTGTGSALKGKRVTQLMKHGFGYHTLVMAIAGPNTAPVISTVNLSTNAPKTKDTLTATPVASDVDDNPLAYTYVWRRNGTIIAGETGPTLNLATAGNGDKGDQITVTVTANDGTDSSAPVASNTVTVANSAPVATSATIAPTNPTTNSVLTATATGTDTDNDPLTFLYVWLKNGTVIPGETGNSLDLSKPGNGDKGDQITVEVRARDTNSNSAPLLSAPATVINSVPTIISVLLAPSAPTSTTVLTATATGSDADKDPLTYTYVWKKNGVTITGETGNTLDLSKAGNGDNGDVITATVIANDGTASSTPLVSASVTVNNFLPQVVSVAPQNTTDKVTDKRTFTVTVSDINGPNDIKEVWLLINERLNWSEGATFIYQPSAQSPTNGLLYLRQGDALLSPIAIGAGSSPTDVLDNGAVRVVGSEVTVSVSGNSITLNIPAVIGNGLVGQNNLYTRVVDRSDTDSGYVNSGTYTVTPQFASGTNSAPTLSPLSPGTTNTALNGSGIAPEAQTFTFDVKDDNGTGDIENVTFFAGKTLNGSNSASIVYVPRTQRLYLRSNDGSTYLGGGQIGSAGIIENSQVRIDLSKVKATLNADGKTLALSLPLQAKSGLLGENKIWVRVQDRQGAISEGGDAQGFVQSGTWNVTGGNRTPVVTGVNLSPSAPTTGGELTAEPVATDADGNTLTYTYKWMKNGNVIVGASGPKLNLATAGFGDKGEKITVEVVANDGTDSSAPFTSQEVIVANTAPVATGVTLASDNHTTNGKITATPAATDEDALDTLSYSYKWYKGSVLIAGETGNVLDLAKQGNGDKGEAVTVEMVANDGTTDSNSVSSQDSITVANSAPKITSVLLDPSAPTTKETLTADIVSSDDDTSDTITYTYEWKKNGETITGETGQSLDLSKEDNGNSGDKITVTVTAKDGTTSSAPVKSPEVTVANSAPKASKVTISPLDPTTKTELLATPVVTDDDDDSLTYSFKWKKGGVLINGASGPTLDLGTNGFGDKGESITVEVVANDGTTNSNSVTSDPVTVLNSAPVATGVSISPTNPSTTSVLTATPAVTDDDKNDRLTYSYQWMKGGAPIIGETNPTLNLATAGNGDEGDKITVEMFAFDGSVNSNKVTSAQVTVGGDAPGNVAPIIASVTLTPGRAFTDSTLTATPIASDGDGDTITYTYEWKKNGQVIPNETSNKLDLDKNGNGGKDDVITVTVVASDGKTVSAPATANLTISNAGPSVTSLVLTPTNPTTGDVIHTTLTGTDPDGDTLTYLFVWRKNGQVLAGETGPTLDLSKAGNGDKGDKITLEVKARDGRANSSPVVSEPITIASTPSSISNVTLSPSAPKTNQIVTATPVATDADGDTLTYSYVWMKNGVVIAGESGKTLDLSKAGNGDRADRISVEVTANDGQVNSAPFTSNAITVANTSPNATGVNITPSAPRTQDVLTANATGTDLDNDKLSFLYQWKKNGVAIAGETAQTLDLAKAGNGDSGDKITVEVKARDASANSSPITSAPVTVLANETTGSGPVVNSVSISPTSPKTSDVVKATVVGAGANGDSSKVTYSYVWKNNGDVVPGEIGSTLDLSKQGNGNKGEAISVEVTAHEGATASAPVTSNSVTVANTASVPTSVVLGPTNPGTNATLTATANGFDADGDPFTFVYQWKKNGVVIPGETGQTLNLGKAGNGDAGDVITVEVKTRDAAGQSAPLASAPVTVSGAAAGALRLSNPSASGS